MSISVDVPDVVAIPLRRLRATLKGRNVKVGKDTADDLVLAPKIPSLRAQRRDPITYMPFFRSFHDTDTAADASPPSGGVANGLNAISWYHTIELPDGQVTPGIFDHRELVPHYGIPEDLRGKRVLDVATFDGFWAFEFERRGADVTALDIGRISQCDMPPDIRRVFLQEGLDRDTGEGFHFVHDALKSGVKRVEHSVYDLDPTTLGMFDLVHVGDLLLHLENPVAALRAIRSVTAGQALISDCVDPSLESGLTRYHGGWESIIWWLPSLDTLAQMILDAGFSAVSINALYSLAKSDSNSTVWRAAISATP